MKKIISIIQKNYKRFMVVLILPCLLGCQKQIVDTQRQIINPQGQTLETRIQTPQDYQRVESNSLISFLRQYPLKKDKSPLLLYNGQEKNNQSHHAAIFKLPIEKVDLQQCADSIMRVYAEYYYQKQDYDKIAFHFVNGFYAKYSKWRKGYKIKVDGRHCKWVKTNDNHQTYKSFQQYLRIVFAYASTLSMYDESYPIDIQDMQVGDIFLKAGSPGHVVMVVDMCEKQGKKAFLLAQGYMPAQEFHVIKNPRHDDVWYYEDEVTDPFVTAEYTFSKNSLRRLKYSH